LNEKLKQQLAEKSKQLDDGHSKLGQEKQPLAKSKKRLDDECSLPQAENKQRKAQLDELKIQSRS